jgi:glycine/D-amino acid oxidase-like deaminating enzyme
MTSRDLLLTDMRHAPGWYAILPEPAPAKRLQGNQVADWVVIGAGITGLAAARRLGELAPDARVLLLDEHRVGYGTSGRNSGFIIDTPHLTEHLSEEDNRRVSRLIVAGLADLESHVKNHDIECEWSQRGHLTAVVKPEREKKLHATVRTLHAANEEYEWYDRNTIAKVTGTDHYHAAVLTPRSVLLNPAALCRGLGETMPANVEVHEETPVRRVEPGSPVRIDCADASISAKNVLLTTNAFIAKLGFLRRGVFPMIACASLSRQLTDDEQDAMGGEPDWGITGVTTLRRTLSNRILVRHGTFYGGDFHLSQTLHRRLLGSHKEILKKRFPMLSGLAHALRSGFRAHLGRRLLYDPRLGIALRSHRTRCIRLPGLLWRGPAPRDDLRQAARRVCHGLGVRPDRRCAGAVQTQTIATSAVSRDRDSSTTGMV